MLSEPYYSQRARSVCVSLRSFFISYALSREVCEVFITYYSIPGF